MKNYDSFSRTRLTSSLVWLPGVLLSSFIFLFLFVAFSRLTTPFELEWNEGQNAMQALRFSQRMGLYPHPESGWVPYMYAPLYHQVLGICFIFGGEELAWGRLISMLSTLATLSLLFWCVVEHTGKWSLGLLSAGLYASMYGASGFFFDLVRNDALSIFLGTLGMVLLTRKSPKVMQTVLGLLALVLATWTKQPFLVLLVLMSLWCLWAKRPGAKTAVFLNTALLVNMGLFYPRWENPEFFRYAVWNALSHAKDYSPLSPGSLGLPYDENPLESGRAFTREFWATAIQDPPRVLTVGFWPLVFWIPLLAAGLVYLKSGKGWVLILPIILLGWSIWASLGAFLKYGGFNNNWMPFFVVVSGLVPLAVAPLLANRGSRNLAAMGLGCLSVAHLIVHLYNPVPLLPKAEDYRGYEALMQELREKKEAGESVWVAHHEWYGYKTGHQVFYNWDMVRCATYAGQPVPMCFRELLESNEVDWLLLNADQLKAEWTPMGMDWIVEENFAASNPVALNDSMWPKSGAHQRPRLWYRRINSGERSETIQSSRE
ncbi:MAG: hypothetical protein SFY68_02555 [Candidatus Sumerlaeia bacterium]|nr:hypothetical protein [Candidatus Sumerlaeia bacterium]